MRKTTYVLDTSVYLHDASSIYQFARNDIVVPLKVLEEIAEAEAAAQAAAEGEKSPDAGAEDTGDSDSVAEDRSEATAETEAKGGEDAAPEDPPAEEAENSAATTESSVAEVATTTASVCRDDSFGTPLSASSRKLTRIPGRFLGASRVTSAP